MAFGEPFGTATFGAPRITYTVSASDTIVGQELLRAYYEALGRFVQMFAEVERVVAETLWAYAETRPEIAKVIFAGVQSDTAANYIKAVAKVTNADTEALADLENVMQQFGTIRGVRNDILHHGASNIAEGKGIVSNAWKAKAEPTEFPISAEALQLMEADLRKIIAHLGYRHLGRPWPRGALGLHALQETLQRPWQYKHREQPRSQRKRAQSQQPRKPDLK
jgi:hypothetical protein